MAFENFYIRSGGSNLNAGSTNTDAATVTSASGAWDTSTRTFTAASGTPFSGVSAGEWASIATDATGDYTPFIAQVESVGGGGASVTVSATIRQGTQPSTSGSGITCRVGGAWASLQILNSNNTTPFTSGTATANMQIHFNAAQAFTTTTPSFAFGGGDTTIVRLLGYQTTPGDVTDANWWTLTLPSVSTTTGQFLVGGAIQMSGFDFTSANVGTTGGFRLNGGGSIRNSWIRNTASNANSHALNMSGAQSMAENCVIEGHTSGTRALRVANATAKVKNCHVIGGNTGVEVSNTNMSAFENLLVTGYAQYGCNVQGGAAHITDCTFRRLGTPGDDGIRVSGATALVYVDNVLVAGATNAVNSSAATSRRVRVNGLQTWNCTNRVVGVPENFELNGVTLTADPFVSTTDHRLRPGSDAVGGGLPKYFPQITGTIGGDAGALPYKDDTSSALATIQGMLEDIQGAGFNPATDSLEAIRDRGDAAWTGGSSLTAEDVWTHGTRELSSLANVASDISDAVVDALEAAAISTGAFALAMWNTLTTENFAGGSLGALVVANLNAAITTRAESGIADTIDAIATSVADLQTGVELTASGLDAVVVETGINFRQAQSMILAGAAGKVSGAGTGTIVIKGANNDTTRITATTDALGNRSALTLSLPT